MHMLPADEVTSSTLKCQSGARVGGRLETVEKGKRRGSLSFVIRGALMVPELESGMEADPTKMDFTA